MIHYICIKNRTYKDSKKFYELIKKLDKITIRWNRITFEFNNKWESVQFRCGKRKNKGGI